MMIRITKLYILILVWITWISIQGHTVVRDNKNFGVHFLRNFAVDLEEIQNTATSCCFVEAHAKCILYE